MKYKQCDWCLKNVGAINIWANTGLAVVKLGGGILSGSTALLADAIHSVADIIVAVVLLVTLKVSAKPPDRNYPYGRGNVEYITLGIISVFILVVAIIIFTFSLRALFAATLPVPGAIGILAAIFSIAGNEIIARHSFCVARQFNSPAVFANAMENRADVLTSTAALIGIIGARMGLRFLDPLAALFVGILISKFAISMLSKSIHGLLGENIDKAELDALNGIAASVPGVQNVYDIKTRKSGQKSLVDLEVGVAPDTKLEEATRICELIKSRILRESYNVGDVSVYLK